MFESQYSAVFVQGSSWALAAMFLAAGIGKLRKPEGVRDALANIGVLNSARSLASHSIAVSEILLGIAWLTSPGSSAVALATMVFLVGASLAVIRVVLSGQFNGDRLSPGETSCGCGGIFIDGPLHWNVVARNALLVGVVITTALLGQMTGAVTNWDLAFPSALTAATVALVVSASDALFSIEVETRTRLAAIERSVR